MPMLAIPLFILIKQEWLESNAYRQILVGEDLETTSYRKESPE